MSILFHGQKYCVIFYFPLNHLLFFCFTHPVHYFFAFPDCWMSKDDLTAHFYHQSTRVYLTTKSSEIWHGRSTVSPTLKRHHGCIYNTTVWLHLPGRHQHHNMWNRALCLGSFLLPPTDAPRSWILRKLHEYCHGIRSTVCSYTAPSHGDVKWSV